MKGAMVAMVTNNLYHKRWKNAVTKIPVIFVTPSSLSNFRFRDSFHFFHHSLKK